jgi:hypothetical protein
MQIGLNMGLFRRRSGKGFKADKESMRSSNTNSDKASLQTSNGSTSRDRTRMHLPEVTIPKPPDPLVDPAGYLRSIQAVRERSTMVMEKAKSNELNHFDINMDMFQNAVDYVVSIIKV